MYVRYLHGVRYRLNLQFHLQYMPIFYTDLLLQSVVGDVLEKEQDVGLCSVLYAIKYKTLFYKLLSLK